ncbi:MAG: hypothetical protein HY335_08140 [Deinococcus sp.]|nr:hypothetical protein [Deinococcus sp.]
MNPPSRLFIKTSLVSLFLTGLLGIVLHLGPWANGNLAYALLPAHVHLGTVGWLGNLVLGVAYWFFPRPKGRYSERLALPSYLLLNTGLLLRLGVEPFQRQSPFPAGPWLLLLSGTLQMLALLVFALSVWPRLVSMQALERARLEARQKGE